MDVIDHTLTHKRCRTQSLIMAAEQDDAGEEELDCTVTFDIPRAHWVVARTGQMPGEVPLVLAFEVIRQAAAVASHLHGVPEDTAFLLSTISFAWPGAAPRFPDGRSFAGTVRLLASGFESRRVTYESAVFDEHGALIGEGVITCALASPATYRRLRRGAPEPAVRHDAHLLRELHDTVDGGRCALLGFDSRDPFHFDHPNDHVPGMLFVHAACALHPWATGGVFRFDRYAELNADVCIDVRPDGAVTFTQGAAEVAVARMSAPGA